MSPLLLLYALLLVFSHPTAACNCRCRCQKPKGCNDVFTNIAACAGYIEGKGPADCYPPPMCCKAIAVLNTIARGEWCGPKRICRCIEQFAHQIGPNPFKPSRIQELPLKCNTTLSFPISEYMDCSKI